MKLYYAEVMNPRKACAVARLVEAPVEFIHVDLANGEHKTPGYHAMNPNAKVPVLTDGDLSLWEANAIMGYLAKRAHSPLWPDGEEIELLRWLSWDADHFTRYAGAIYFEYSVKSKFGLGSPDPDAVAEAGQYLAAYGRILDSHLRENRYVLGDDLTIADFALGVTLPMLNEVWVPLEGLDHIRRWHDSLIALDAWRDPFPHTPAS